MRRPSTCHERVPRSRHDKAWRRWVDAATGARACVRGDGIAMTPSWTTGSSMMFPLASAGLMQHVGARTGCGWGSSSGDGFRARAW